MENKIVNFGEAAHQISDAVHIEEEDVPSNTSYPIEGPEGKLYCQVCGKLFKTITASHLKKFHNMTPTEYKNKYGTELVSKATIARRKFSNSQLFKKQEEVKAIPPQNINYDDDVIEEITDEDEAIDIQDQIADTIVDEELTDENDFSDIPIPTKDPGMMKTEISYHLENVFEGHKAEENYIIEEFTIGAFVDTQNLKYSYVTDVSIPSLKIALFFPDTFWHNRDINNDPNRFNNLKDDGWHPIEIFGNNPSFDDVMNSLKNANLI